MPAMRRRRRRMVEQVLKHALARKEKEALKKLQAASHVRKELQINSSKIKDQRITMSKTRYANSAGRSRKQTPNPNRAPSIIISGAPRANIKHTNPIVIQKGPVPLETRMSSLSVSTNLEQDACKSRFSMNSGK